MNNEKLYSKANVLNSGLHDIDLTRIVTLSALVEPDSNTYELKTTIEKLKLKILDQRSEINYLKRTQKFENFSMKQFKELKEKISVLEKEKFKLANKNDMLEKKLKYLENTSDKLIKLELDKMLLHQKLDEERSKNSTSNPHNIKNLLDSKDYNELLFEIQRLRNQVDNINTKLDTNSSVMLPTPIPQHLQEPKTSQQHQTEHQNMLQQQFSFIHNDQNDLYDSNLSEMKPTSEQLIHASKFNVSSKHVIFNKYNKTSLNLTDNSESETNVNNNNASNTVELPLQSAESFEENSKLKITNLAVSSVEKHMLTTIPSKENSIDSMENYSSLATASVASAAASQKSPEDISKNDDVDSKNDDANSKSVEKILRSSSSFVTNTRSNVSCASSSNNKSNSSKKVNGSHPIVGNVLSYFEPVIMHGRD